MTKFDELMDIITHNKNNGKNGYIKDEDILFMKTKVKLSIFLFFGLVSLISVFPFIFVEAAKLESGVTIKEAAPPTNEICNNGIDDNGNGAIDEVTCLPPPASPATETCGLQIVDGVPINYGQLNPGQGSAEQKVTIKNLGTATATILVKGGDWIMDAVPNPVISGPEITHVGGHSTIGSGYDSEKSPLSSSGLKPGQISGGQSLPLYFQFRAWLNVPSGSYHQEVTIDLLC